MEDSTRQSLRFHHWWLLNHLLQAVDLNAIHRVISQILFGLSTQVFLVANTQRRYERTNLIDATLYFRLQRKPQFTQTMKMTFALFGKWGGSVVAAILAKK